MRNAEKNSLRSVDNPPCPFFFCLHRNVMHVYRSSKDRWEGTTDHRKCNYISFCIWFVLQCEILSFESKHVALKIWELRMLVIKSVLIRNSASNACSEEIRNIWTILLFFRSQESAIVIFRFKKTFTSQFFWNLLCLCLCCTVQDETRGPQKIFLHQWQLKNRFFLRFSIYPNRRDDKKDSNYISEYTR